FFEGTAFLSSVQMMVRSFDGGNRFERPTPVALVKDIGAFDGNQSDFTIDGIGGARTNSYPSVDIANGAPTGAGATDRIVMALARLRCRLALMLWIRRFWAIIARLRRPTRLAQQYGPMCETPSIARQSTPTAKSSLHPARCPNRRHPLSVHRHLETLTFFRRP